MDGWHGGGLTGDLEDDKERSIILADIFTMVTNTTQIHIRMDLAKGLRDALFLSNAT